MANTASGRDCGVKCWTPSPDGLATAEEVEALRAARFSERDTDQDGFLSLEEMQAGGMKGFAGQGREHDADEMADRSQRMLRYMDENGDGKVAFDEMPGHDAGRMISRVEADEDGKISKAGLDDAKTKYRMGRKGEGHGGPRNKCSGLKRRCSPPRPGPRQCLVPR